MEDFFASGRPADIGVAILLGEGAWAFVRARLRGGPIPWGRLAHLGSGAALMAALRFALTGAPWGFVAFAMSAGFAFHMAERLKAR